MKLLILGCGLMAPAAAYNAALSTNVKQVLLTDEENEPLEAAQQYFGSTGVRSKISTALLDCTEKEETLEVMAGADVIIAALPQRFTPEAIRAANDAGKPLVSMITPPAADMKSLKKETAKAGNLVIVGCGVDPGLSEIMIRRLADRLDRVEAVHIKCGGIPEKPQPPLGYKVVFGGHELPLSLEDAAVVENGSLRSIPRYSGVEEFAYPGVGTLEAYHEGFMPWLLELDPLKDLPTGTQKSVRWPGYAEKINILKEIGLLNRKPVEVNGVPVSPRQFLDALLLPKIRLQEGERDLVVFHVEVSGERKGTLTTCIMKTLIFPDEKKGLTAMARITGSTTASVARMIGRGELAVQGLFTPEKVITGAHLDRLVGDLTKEGMTFEFSEA